MSDFRIYKDKTEKELLDSYNAQLMNFANGIAKEYRKGKRTLIITGSGISSSVPNMQELMDEIKRLVEEYGDSWHKSQVFEEIFKEYLNCDSSEKHQKQSKLLTYIQNAYMGKTEYVNSEDLNFLAEIWSKFIEWLLRGTDDKKNNGLISAEPSESHNLICEMYHEMNAISITTNFDNLLQKAFKNKGLISYPILDIESFNKYYLSNSTDNSYIEIQSRGDAFWQECTGNKSKICLNMHRQCFVPGENIKMENGKVICNSCGSDVKIYFAFPGTKEKDAEMSTIFNGVWKYLANSVSHVVIIGSSMDYDPVLIEFLRELIHKRKVRVLYISRLKKDGSSVIAKSKEDYSEIFEKEATKFLFSNFNEENHIWARSEKTEEILDDLLTFFRQSNPSKGSQNNNFENERKYFDIKIDTLFDDASKFNQLFVELTGSTYVPKQLLVIDDVKQMSHFSQLGLKTYWLNGNNSPYQEHNRLKHSIGVMIIASYLYFKVCNNPDMNELSFLQTAALLHDLGHLPFSHLLEEVFNELGWTPVGESITFNHEQHTRHLIEKLYNSCADFRNAIDPTGYTINDLILLINGEFGKGYLDSFINSPIDCDKIEYLFSDSIFMNRGTKKDFISFINNFVGNLSINENNFLVIEGNSTKSFLDLIRMRGEMYDQVYLRNGLRYLEACCKLIIRIFIVYKCAEKTVFEQITNKEKFPDFFNLSDSKINIVVNYMVECLKEIKENEVCEIQILDKMANSISQNAAISNVMKKTVENCMKLITKVHGDEGIARIEKERIVTYEVSDNKFDKSVLKQLLKTVYLRFPGVILVDYVESKSSFSFGKRETRKRRSDGTTNPSENIVIKDISLIKGKVYTKFICLGEAAELVNRQLNYSNHSYINIYRITENLFQYMQAEDYILSELRKEGIIDDK